MRANLKTALQLRRVRVIQLAVAVGKDASQISHFIQGHADPDCGLRRRIAEFLQADENWLFRNVKRVPPFSRSGRKRNPEPSAEAAEVTNAR